MRRGQQSYPLAIDGRLYVTTNDANVFAIDGATGKILWQYKPRNSAVFKNFGIVANRGLAYCGGKLFIAAARHEDRRAAPERRRGRRRPSRSTQDVPDASANYGYSETSAPICANGRVVVGAAGLGVRHPRLRDGVHDRPEAGLAEPVLDDSARPAVLAARLAAIVGGGAGLDAGHDRRDDEHASSSAPAPATPLYFPYAAAGHATRARTRSSRSTSRTGRLKWWQQLIAGNQWGYDVAQPPLVYNGKVGGEARRIVSVATKEGVWFAFDARTGAAVPRAREGDRPRRAPAAAGPASR